jgi:hypothetical protein
MNASSKTIKPKMIMWYVIFGYSMVRPKPPDNEGTENEPMKETTRQDKPKPKLRLSYLKTG